ncbi:MAG: HDOD domain-containing protein [Spirochaetaceae bacterium]|jgi:HD-like signal output (HDOD) protein|nr:HDOD domain-containing protein [Spirochaetaceae bacterium]
MSEIYEKYMIEIPLVPEVAAKIMQMNEDDESISSQYLSDLISLDPYLSASILKIANSALYSRRSEIKELPTAVNLIGFKKIKTMVLLLAGASLFKKNKNSYFYQLFWQHSIISAFLSRDIAVMIGEKKNAEEYFTAALIHRIGEVPLYLSNPEKYLNLIDENKNGDYTLSRLEAEIFNADSCQIGGALLEFWNFPDSLINTAKYASSENNAYTDKLVDVVTISDLITVQIGFGIPEYVEDDKLKNLINISGLKEENYEYLVS